MITNHITSFLLVSDAIKGIDPNKVDEMGKKAFDIFTIVKKFNYISIYQWLVDNAWITIAGFRVPLVVLFILGFIILTFIARKIRSIAIMLIIMALIAFANTFIQFTIGA